MKSNIVFSHNSDDWSTPKILYKHFLDHGCIDPCPLKCEVDNLFRYYRNSCIFINPPYSKIKDWCYYALYLAKLGNIVYLLIPSRTDTKYFQYLLNSHCVCECWFFEGRLRFNDSNPAPFPSVLITLKLDTRSKILLEYGSISNFISRGFVYE